MGAKLSFNTRVVECRLATLLLTLKYCATLDLSKLFTIITLRDFQRYFQSIIYIENCVVSEIEILRNITQLVPNIIRTTSYSINCIIEILEENGYSIDSNLLDGESRLDAFNRLFFKSSVSSLEVLNIIEEYDLFNRCIHVFEEAMRVWEFRLECESNTGISRD